MKSQDTKKIISNLTSKKNYLNSLEDLQYNLTTFLNEDIYLSQIEKYGSESILVITYLLKANVIFVREKDERILLTPTGEILLIEVNNMLFNDV